MSDNTNFTLLSARHLLIPVNILDHYSGTQLFENTLVLQDLFLNFVSQDQSGLYSGASFSALLRQEPSESSTP